jgi:hypothetical protein
MPRISLRVAIAAAMVAGAAAAAPAPLVAPDLAVGRNLQVYASVRFAQPLPAAAQLVLTSSDPKRLGNGLALRVRVVEHGTIRSYRVFPGNRFRLLVPQMRTNKFIEHVPSALRLVYSAPSGDEAELLVLHQVGHELTLTGGEVIQSYDFVSPGQQLLGQVAGDKAGTSSDHDLPISELH